MSVSPIVSIIIVNWNTAELLASCLSSIARGTTVPHEVLVVDNASSDDSCRRVTAEFPSVHLLPQSTNLGFARANNLALAIAQGRFLLLLNPDTEVRVGAVDSMVSFLDARATVGIVGPPLWSTRGDHQPSVQSFPSLTSELLRQTMLYRVLPNRFRREAKRRDTRRVEVVSGAALCIRRECYAAIGPLDEAMFMFYEDTDWCRRAHQAGWEVWYVDGPGIVHREGSASMGAARTRTLVDSLRSTVYFFEKHDGRGAVPALRAIALLGGVARSLRATALFLAGRDRTDQRARLRGYVRMIQWSLRGGAP